MSLINLIKRQERMQIVEEITSTFIKDVNPNTDGYNASNLDCRIFIDFDRSAGHASRFKIIMGSKTKTTDKNKSVSVSIPNYELVVIGKHIERKDYNTINIVTQFMQTRIMKYILTDKSEEYYGRKRSYIKDDQVNYIIDDLFPIWTVNTDDNDEDYHNYAVDIVYKHLGRDIVEKCLNDDKNCPFIKIGHSYKKGAWYR